MWVIEDSVRLKEKDDKFDEEFIELARAVYYTNDRRAAEKKDTLKEEKYIKNTKDLKPSVLEYEYGKFIDE